MLREIYQRLTRETRYDEWPCIGIFYVWRGGLITCDFCQWPVNPATGDVPEEYAGLRIEHRDMWDAVIVPDYPEAAEAYGDDHKAMPRGRVELISKQRTKPVFRVTLCPCLKDFQDQVVKAFHLEEYGVEWYFGTMNYLCPECRCRMDAEQNGVREDEKRI